MYLLSLRIIIRNLVPESIPNNNNMKNTDEKVILKEHANRYTCEGRLSNFNLLKKPDRKVIDKKYAMSFSEFKKLNLTRL